MSCVELSRAAPYGIRSAAFWATHTFLEPAFRSYQAIDESIPVRSGVLAFWRQRQKMVKGDTNKIGNKIMEKSTLREQHIAPRQPFLSQ